MLFRPVRSEMKATDPRSLFVATLGGRPGGNFWEPSLRRRPDMRALLQRYGRWVYRCIDINAKVAAAIPIRLFVPDRSGIVAKSFHGARRPTIREKAFLRGDLRCRPGARAMKAIQGSLDDLTQLDAHPLLTLLNDVNQHTEGFSFRIGIYSDLQAFGRGFEHMIAPGPTAPPTELYRMMPHLTKVLPDPVDFVRGFEYGHGATKATYTPDEVLWFRLFDPDNPWGGMGPLEAWLKSIDADFAMAAFQEDLFQRGGSPDWLAITKTPMGEPQKRAFWSEWRRAFGRLYNRLRNIAFLSGEVTMQRLQDKPRDLEYAKGREAMRDEICQAFGVPKALVTSDDVNLANAREGSVIHITTTIWPLVQMVEDRLNQVLVPRFGDRLILVHENPLREDREIRIQERRSRLETGATINEIRAEDDMEALDDPLADVPMIAAGIVPLSAAGVGAGEVAGGDGEGSEAEGAGEDETPETGVLDIPTADLVALVGAVRDRKLTVEAARAQLVLSYGATDEQAARLVPDAIEPEDVPAQAPPPAPGTPGTPGAPPQAKPKALTEPQSQIDDDWGVFIKAANDPGDGAADYDNPEFAFDLAAVYRRQINSVIERLSDGKAISMMETKAEPDPDPEVYINAQGWAEEIATVAERHIGLTMVEAGGKAIETLGVEGVSFAIDTASARTYIQETSRRVGGQTADTLVGDLRQQLAAGIEAGESTREIAKRIQAMGESVRWRADRVARTETAFAMTAGMEEAWSQSGVVEGKRFLKSPDACPICEAVDAEWSGVTQPLGKPFYAKGSAIDVPGSDTPFAFDYADMQGAPVHPHCRCSVEPVLSEVER